MKKYDRDVACKKCGYGGIDDKHVKEIIRRNCWEPGVSKYEICGSSPPEHIARTCRNCGYSWRESPVDGDISPWNEVVKNMTEPVDPAAMPPSHVEISPVIEVGDVVESTSTLCNLKRECIVSGEKDGAVRLIDPLDSMCSCTPSPLIRLTLIRKGPKVHRFGYVEWKKLLYATIPHVNDGSNEPFDKLNGKKGTLTFKEDYS